LFVASALAGHARASNQDGMDALRHEFLQAGPPNLQAVVQESATLGAIVLVEKFAVTEATNGTIEGVVEQQELHRFIDAKCAVTGTKNALYAGLVVLEAETTKSCQNEIGRAHV